MTESSTQVGQIEAIDTIGTGLKKITLLLDVDKPLRFKAGQYLAIPIPDQNKISYFSIASSPTLENKIELIIKEDKQAASPRYLLSLSCGDTVPFQAPFGTAYFREESAHNLLFVAGASGTSYVRSIIHYLLESCLMTNRSVYYFFGVQKENELCELDYWQHLSSEHPNFYFVPVISNLEGSENFAGETGLVTEAVDRKMNELIDEWDVYAAGSKAMIEALADLLLNKKNLPPERFFSDMYRPQTN